MRRLGELVASSRATFGVRFDPMGERLSIVDDTGRPIDDDRALLVFLDLVAAERGDRPGRAAGDDDARGRAGVPLPRRRGALDHDGGRRPGPRRGDARA